MPRIFEAEARPSAWASVNELADDLDTLGLQRGRCRAEPMPAIPAMGFVWDSWVNAGTLVMTGELDPAAALTQAVEQVEPRSPRADGVAPTAMRTRGIERVPTGEYVRAALVTIAFAVGALWLVRSLLLDGLVILASGVSVITIFLLIVYLRRRFSAMRWMAIGVSLAALFSVYPILFNVYIGFTNLGDGHLLSKQQSIERLESEQYLAEGRATFTWAGYRSDDATPSCSPTPTRPVRADPAPTSPPSSSAAGRRRSRSATTGLHGSERGSALLDALADVQFGDPDAPVRIQSFREAAVSQPRYRYDSDADADHRPRRRRRVPCRRRARGRTGRGGAGSRVHQRRRRRQLRPLPHQRQPADAAAARYRVELRLRLLLGRPQLRPRARRRSPVRRPARSQIIRALLIIPYPIPVLVSVLIWRSMLNPDLGTIGELFEAVFGSSPQFFLDAKWTASPRRGQHLAVVPVLLRRLLGGVARHPEELYDAAEVDGAGVWQRFRYITFPQLIVIVMPLLIASFSFNFNNFNLVYIFNNGNPPMADTIIPVGQTDILISFVYKLAFVYVGDLRLRARRGDLGRPVRGGRLDHVVPAPRHEGLEDVSTTHPAEPPELVVAVPARRADDRLRHAPGVVGRLGVA